MKRLLTVLVIATLADACGVDQKKFEATYRAGKTIQSSVSSGVNLLKYRELNQTLATELSIAKDHAKGSAEQKLITAYDAAATSYHDALVIWELKVSGSSDWIYGGPTLEKMLVPYAVKFEDPGPRASADTTMQTIWTVAGSRLDAANAIFNGR